ncbi:MAG: YceI family protein [Bacteroidia bacterium]
MKKLISIFTAIAITTLSVAQTYSLDKNHSRLGFSATHFAISHVEGNFKTFDVTMKSAKADFSDATVEVIADVKSINTEIDKRDEDLKSANWFDAEKYPKLTFRNSSLKKISGNKYKMEGFITIHGVTKPITLDVIYNGKALNPMTKKYSVGFTISGKLNRSDFGVGTEAFAAVVSNEIELKADIEFIID